MKWTIQNVDEQNFIKVSLEGNFSVKKLPQALAELFSCKGWQPGKPILFDNTNLDLVGIDLDEVRDGSQIYFENAGNYGDSKVAILAGSLADFARGRQFELLTENKVKSNIRIFLKEAEALDWLLSAPEVKK